MNSRKPPKKAPLAIDRALATICAAPLKCTTGLAQRLPLAVVQFVMPKPVTTFAQLENSQDTIVLAELRVRHSHHVQRPRILEDLSQRGMLVLVTQAETHDSEPPIFQVDLYKLDTVDVFHLFRLFDLLEDHASQVAMEESE